ncbi:trypsin-like serine protease [Streptomyces sp. NPDC017941]|uniref:trypsin-like serine protease n=1 Tax=Streptomyces sp. NPDC017941 TaxID=3365018 RepID=UPI00379B6B46
MLASHSRSARTTGVLVSVAAISTGMIGSAPVRAVTGPDVAAGTYASVAKLNIGDRPGSRACTAVLVDERWLATAASCFATTPGEQVPAGKPAMQSTATLSDGRTVEIAELLPRTDRDLTLARLATPATGIAGVRRAAAPADVGATLTAAGFGRTRTEWVPGKLHTGAFTVDSADSTTLSSTGKGTDALCKGDTGGPLMNASGELVAINSRSWQGGCLGTPTTEVRTGAVSARIDDLHDWVQQARALTPGWKTETLVQAGSTLYQGIRLADGSWTGFADVQAKVGDIGGIRTAAAAGIDGDTHVLALGGDGRIRHAIRTAQGRWGGYGDVGAVAGVLGDVTQLSAVSIGADLHVVAVADGRIFHTQRRADGTWSRFGDIASVVGPLGTITHAATASVGGRLHIAAVSGGKAYHASRDSAGHWTGWGDIAQVAGDTGPLTSVTMAGAGNDTHFVIATDDGSRQYHAIRRGDGNWERFGELTDQLGGVQAKSVSAGTVDGELQVAVTTSDNRLLHTIRHTDRTWAPTLPVATGGVTGNFGSIAITGTL